jgi:hypothetical protein
MDRVILVRPGAVLAMVSQEKKDPLWIGVSKSSPDEHGWFSIDWYTKKSSGRGREISFELSQGHSNSRESVGSVLLELERTNWKFADRSADIVLPATYYRDLKKIATQTQVSLLASDTPALRQQVQPERVSHEIACPSLAVQAENFKSNLEMIRSSLLQVNIFPHF